MSDQEPGPDDYQHAVKSSDSSRDTISTTMNQFDNDSKIEIQRVVCERIERESSVARRFDMSNWSVGFVWKLRSSTVRNSQMLWVWSLLAATIAAMTPPGRAATTLSKFGGTTQLPAPTTPSRRNALIDTLIIGSGTLMCLVLVVGARYWRTSWAMPAPAMGASGIAFLLWNNDSNISAEVTWITFAVWATATLVNVWTAKHRLPPRRFTSYIIFSSILTGALIYIFAAALQERIISAIPSCTAFSFYTGEVALRKCGFMLSVRDEDPMRNGLRGDEDDVL